MDTTPASPTRRQPWWRWVPIRRLRATDRARIERHLLALGERDRYLRFGYPASDERIRHYAASIDFGRDEVFGIFNRRLQLLAVSHLACADLDEIGAAATQRMAEFAVSVDARARGRGYGARLFDHAVRHARNHGIDRLFIHALSENTAMLRIARRAGAELRSDGGETEAWLHLPPHSLLSQLQELLARQATELNYQSKRGQRQCLHLMAWGRHLLMPDRAPLR